MTPLRYGIAMFKSANVNTIIDLEILQTSEILQATKIKFLVVPACAIGIANTDVTQPQGAVLHESPQSHQGVRQR